MRAFFWRKRGLALLLLLVLAAAAAWWWWYKRWDERRVAADTDQVLVIDAHRIRNTLITEFLSDPAKWSVSWSRASTSQSVDWLNVVEIPDYAFVFHRQGQPANAWYLVLAAKEPSQSAIRLQQLEFTPLSPTTYQSVDGNIDVTLSGDYLVFGNGAITDKTLLAQTADDLLIKKQHVSSATVNTWLPTNKHLSFHGKASAWWDTATGWATVNTNKYELDLLLTSSRYPVQQPAKLNYDSNAMLNLSWVQPDSSAYHLLGDSTRAKASRWVNFHIDSLAAARLQQYRFSLYPFRQRSDTAITSVFDESFNEVQQKTIHHIAEPSFELSLYGDGANPIRQYWQRNGNIDDQAQFQPSPFVASSARWIDNEITIASRDRKSTSTRVTDSACLVYGYIKPGMLADSMRKKLPSWAQELFAYCGNTSIRLTQPQKNQLRLQLVIDRK